MHRLFAYPNSSDLYAVEEELLRAFSDFVRAWPVSGVLLTNKKAPLMEGQDLPDWNLGLRVETETFDREAVDLLLSFLSGLSRKVSIPFVVGTWGRSYGTRDLCFIEQQVPFEAARTILEGSRAA